MTDRKLRTLIIDDEPLAIDRMMRLCESIPAVQPIGAATNGIMARDLIDSIAPDLILLDISMPGLDGMELAKLIMRKSGHRPMIIFVTAHDGFAVEAFDLPAIDYLLKPVSAERLARAVERAGAALAQVLPSSSQEEQQWVDEFWVPHRSELIRIAAADIERVDAERDYMRLSVGSRSFLLHQTIAALEARLDPEKFIRLHRSVIVRRDRIRGFQRDRAGAWCALLHDGAVVRVGRTYLPAAKAMAGRASALEG